MNFLFKTLSYYQGAVNKSLLQRGPALSRPYPSDSTMEQNPLIIVFFFFWQRRGRILTKPTYGKPTGSSISFLFRVYDPREQHRHERSLSFSLLLLIFRQWFKNRLESDSILQRGLLSYQSSWKSPRCLAVRIVLSPLNSENNSSTTTMAALYFRSTVAQKCVGWLCSVKWVLLIAVSKPTGRLSYICIMRMNCPHSAEEFNWQSQMI